MASAFVQAVSNPGQATDAPSVTITGVGAGHSLIVHVSATSEDRDIDSIADNGGGPNTWAIHDHISDGDIGAMGQQASSYNVPAGDYVITCTMSSSATYTVSVIEVSGLTTATDPFDQYATASVAGAETLAVGPTGTTAQAAEMAVLFSYGKLSARDYTDPSGWTRRVNETGAGTYHVVWTKPLSSAGAQTQTLHTTPNNHQMLGILSTFEDAASGPGLPEEYFWFPGMMAQFDDPNVTIFS